jgi:hypothetical protein
MLDMVTADRQRVRQGTLRQAAQSISFGVEEPEMLPDYVARCILNQLFGALVPVNDETIRIQPDDSEVPGAFHHKTHAMLTLGEFHLGQDYGRGRDHARYRRRTLRRRWPGGGSSHNRVDIDSGFETHQAANTS